MKNNINAPFTYLKFENWRYLLFFAILCFYFILFFLYVVSGVPGSDYELYWSTGKIADKKGYSQIYSLSEMRNVYRQVIDESGDYANNEILINKVFPVAYFSVFFVIFQFLSRISVVSGFQIWTFLNLAILIGYLFFFLRGIDSENRTNFSKLKLLIPFLISYPVFFNIMCGQVEVFVLICAGEFVRQAGNKKPFLSGLWLGGFLLKPQLLIFIIPIFVIMRYWKALIGFFASSGIILTVSLQLSGLTGMRALIDLWTKYSYVIPDNALQIMINWRMVGATLNILFNTSLGWVITGLGIILTILAVFFLIKQIPSYGSSLWVLKMMGVFAATLAISWHALFHMAMVLIPFLVYALVKKLLPEKIALLWGITTPVVYLGILIFESFFFGLMRIDPNNIREIVIAFTGLLSNLLIVIIVTYHNKNREIPLSKLSIMSNPSSTQS